MPELPEAETMARALHGAIAGAVVQSVRLGPKATGRWCDRNSISLVQGQRIRAVERRGKAIIVQFEGTLRILCQLGMSGRMRVVAAAEPATIHEHLLVRLDDEREWRFADVRRFGGVKIFSDSDPLPKYLANLGPEPLECSAEQFRGSLQGSRRSIKEALLDQRILAGVGNIYASETLFAARIHPARKAGDLNTREVASLLGHLKKVLKTAIALGGSSISDYRRLDGSEGFFAQRLKVYGREGLPCTCCKNPLEHIVQGGRSTWFCSQCQH
jgi:formamidopyrimidine-DNA glycosylase